MGRRCDPLVPTLRVGTQERRKAPDWPSRFVDGLGECLQMVSPQVLPLVVVGWIALAGHNNSGEGANNQVIDTQKRLIGGGRSSWLRYFRD